MSASQLPLPSTPVSREWGEGFPRCTTVGLVRTPLYGLRRGSIELHASDRRIEAKASRPRRRQQQSRRQHRTGARVARHAVPPETGRDLRHRSRRRTPRAAASVSLLRWPHGRHRDLRRRLPAETSPCARYSGDQDRHLVMPSPPTHQPSDIRRLRWLSASTASAFSRSINRPAVAPPTLSSNAPCRSFSPSPRPIVRPSDVLSVPARGTA